MGLQSSFNSAFLRIDDGTVVFDNLNVSVGNGNVLAAYGFKSASPAAAYVAAGLAAGDFTPFGPDAGFSAGENAYLRSNYTGADQAAALADTDYFSVTFTVAKANFFMDLDSLTLTTGGSAGLAFDNEIYLQSIVGGFGTGNPVITAIGSTAGITTGTTAQPYDMNAPGSTSFDLTGPEFQGLSTITFQIRYSDSINDNNSINRFDDVTLFGVVRALRGTVIVIQ
jgi:hypothetical protein